jgi:hypothetical protein
MADTESMKQPGATEFPERLSALESRIAALESEVRSLRNSKRVQETDPVEDNPEDYRLSFKLPGEGSEGGFESKIGEYGLAWLGNIVLFFGIVFLTQYLINTGHPFVSAIIGFLSVAGILILARAIRGSYSYMAATFTVFAQVLLFYTAVRLYFFTEPQVVTSKAIALVLLLAITGYQYFEAVRKRSEGYSVLALMLAMVLAILSDHTHVMLPLVAASAMGAFYLFDRFGWHRQMVFAVILNYLVFMIWLINNPLMGHPAQAVASHQYAFFYLAVCGATYSMVTLVKQKGLFPDHLILTTVIVNGLGFSAVLGLVVLTFFAANYIWIFASIAMFCASFSAILKYQSPWKYSPALYAVYGFVAVSMVFYGIWGLPRAYVMLSLQSLLVVSVALWFRSRIIVVMNLFLFMTLLLGYAAGSGNLQAVNFSFPAVAFLSARIINWQKDRLNIKTELIRNTYMVILFITLLYAFYKAVPGQYVTLSWTLAALFYFVLSIVLKNVKYRYMAVATMLATAIYLFAVDLARIGIIYRIFAFLFLAIISIAISAYYVRRIKKSHRVTESPSDQVNGNSF